MKKGLAVLSALAMAFAMPAFAGDVAVCHIPPGNPGNAHTINIDDSAVPAHMGHGDMLGACSGNGGGGGNSMLIDVDQVRTYCQTDPLKVQTSATDLSSGLPALVPDHQNTTFGNEVVWRLIGALPQGPTGEGYCGALPYAVFTGGPPLNLDGVNRADVLQDCVAVYRFAVPAGETYLAASLNIDGVNTGVNNTVAVSTCAAPQSAVDAGVWLDDEGDAASGTNPDCIIDGLDFAGGSFAAIHDVQLQKADNNVGVIGGADDIVFGEFLWSRSINLNYEGVSEINAAADGYINLIVRCANTTGSNNGFLGVTSNMMLLHDPAGLGFGLPATTQLELFY